MRLTKPVEAAAYYIVAEALTNATKHAEASEARVQLRWRTARSRSASPTTASAARTSRAARASAASPTGSTRSAARSPSRARPAAAHAQRADAVLQCPRSRVRRMRTGSV